MGDLRLIKWNHLLNEHFWNDERYRLFLENGCWFNPFTNNVDPSIRKDGNVISRGTISDIARALAINPQADPSRLSSLQSILNKNPELSPQEEDDGQGEITIDSGDFTIGGPGNTLPQSLQDDAESFFDGSFGNATPQPSQDDSGVVTTAERDQTGCNLPQAQPSATPPSPSQSSQPATQPATSLAYEPTTEYVEVAEQFEAEEADEAEPISLRHQRRSRGNTPQYAQRSRHGGKGAAAIARRYHFMPTPISPCITTPVIMLAAIFTILLN